MKKIIKIRNPLFKILRQLKKQIVKPKKGKGSYNRKKQEVI